MAWAPACKVADVDEGEGYVLERSPLPPVAVFNVAGEFHAVDDTCTHEDYSLADGYIDDSADGWIVECPLHMAKFSICTGKALCLPATRDLVSYPTKVEDGIVLVDL